MTVYALLVKVNMPRQLKQIEEYLRSQFRDLDVVARILDIKSNKWVQIDLSGEDQAVAANYLAQEFGFCPVSLENVDKFVVLRGYITELGKDEMALFLDVGVLHPSLILVKLPLERLQAQLVEGEKVALKKIIDLFGLCDDLSLTVRITKVDVAERYLEAELADKQVDEYLNWEDSLLDKLIIIGSSPKEVNVVLDHTGLDRDIIAVESVGAFEQILTCKLGTDAAGLIPIIGKSVRNAKISVFSPRKIRQFLRNENKRETEMGRAGFGPATFGS